MGILNIPRGHDPLKQSMIRSPLAGKRLFWFLFMLTCNQELCFRFILTPVLEITSDDHEEVFLFSIKNKIAYGEIQAEAKWISMVKDREGKVLRSTEYMG